MSASSRLGAHETIAVSSVVTFYAPPLASASRRLTSYSAENNHWNETLATLFSRPSGLWGCRDKALGRSQAGSFPIEIDGEV